MDYMYVDTQRNRNNMQLIPFLSLLAKETSPGIVMATHKSIGSKSHPFTFTL